jgi:hypothetical protein
MAERRAEAEKPRTNVWDASHMLWRERNRTDLSEPPLPRDLPRDPRTGRLGSVSALLSYLQEGPR